MINKQRLRRLVAPKSIAVFGSRGADFAIRESLAMGFEGPIWSVHPQREQLMGIKCLQSVTDLPQAPDAAYVAAELRPGLSLSIRMPRARIQGCQGPGARPRSRRKS